MTSETVNQDYLSTNLDTLLNEKKKWREFDHGVPFPILVVLGLILRLCLMYQKCVESYHELVVTNQVKRGPMKDVSLSFY